jgi:CRISPR-associated Csh1 family protein
MITAIANLAQGWQNGEVAALIAKTNAKYVIVLEIKIQDEEGKYTGAQLEENKGAERYLYGKSPHWPGLFVTGRLSQMDIQTVKQAIKIQTDRTATEKALRKAKEAIIDFKEKKICWIPKGTIINDEALTSKLSQPWRNALLSIGKAVNNEIDRMTEDILRKIEDFSPKKGESSELLLTFKLKIDSDEFYVGDIDEYVSIFRLAVIRSRGKGAKKNNKAVACTICNKVDCTGVFEHPPLPFFTIDKQNFIPSGDPLLGFKVFPLCPDCYMKLRCGQAYVEQNLNFIIPNSKGKGAPIKFWLIPVLNNQFLQEYLTNINHDGLYLKNLRTICEKMDFISRLDTDSNEFEAFLSYTAVFYTVDTQGHMRLISSEQGIFPKRLRQILEAKTQVDSIYPFAREKIRFGFPVLRDFIERPKSEGWYSEFATLMGSIFLDTTLDADFVYAFLISKIRETANENRTPESLKDIVLKALAAIDYLLLLDLFELPVGDTSYMSIQTNVRQADEVKKFLDAHSKLLSNGTMRAVCAVGISVGILLEVQRKRPGNSMPFWGRLNRLELTLEKVQSLFPQVITKLQQYNERNYDQLITFLGSEEVSKIDPRADDLPNDLVNLVFAVGLTEGHMIYNSAVETEKQ